MEFSRENPEYARFVIEKLVSDEHQRRTVLELLAKLIEIADTSPDKWGVTLHGSEVALNMGGGYYSLWLKRERLHLYWLQENGLEEPNGAEDCYKLFPGSRYARLPLADALAWIERLLPRMEALTVKANSWSQAPLLPRARDAHSPGVLRYLENELEIILPDPQYPQSVRTTHYWRVGTREGGEKIDRWPAMRDGNFVSIGFAALGDLNSILAGLSGGQIREALKERMLPMVVNPASVAGYAAQWHKFFEEMQLGDIVVAMDGQRVLGIGTVTGSYEFDPEDSLQPHHHPVRWDWIVTGEHKWEKHPGYLTTVSDFTTNASAVAYVRRLLGELPESALQPETTPISMSETHALNTILYGPPGTGKTYETAKRAVEIIDGSAPTDRKALMDRYRELQQDGHIAFVTFHQSYSYEDFVEGIRPVMNSNGADSSPRYQVVDGILKELAKRAMSPEFKHEEPLDVSQKKEIDFDDIWSMFVDYVKNNPHREYIIDGDKSGKTYAFTFHGENYVTYCDESIEVEGVGRAYITEKTIQRDYIRGFWRTVYFSDETGLRKANALNRIRGTVYEVIYNIMRRLMTAKYESLYSARPATANHVLIVDEINRGNISKILGELITLLEDDKRLGKENELTVTLPYSRETFGLPANLYLIGTMNTADKSLALLDVALRRRFSFEELPPRFDVCGLDPEMKRVLETLNERITLRKDRDHRIGHAFFMGVGSDEVAFNHVFHRKVIPLLQEYFYNDWEGVRWVLKEKDNGKGFVRPLGTGEAGVRNKWQWYTDAGVTLKPLDALKANYGPDTPA